MIGASGFRRELFRVRTRDLDRIARRMERYGEARDLTQLLRRFVRGRLRYGAERGDLIGVTAERGEAVRLWDPAEVWREGDWAVFAVPALRDRDRPFVPCLGEIVKVQGQGVIARVDGHAGTRVFGIATAEGRNGAVAQWRQSLEALVAKLSERDDERSRIERAIWSHGAAIASDLRAALSGDVRFVALDGRWMLRRLAVAPTGNQLEDLARRMVFDADRPLPAEELLRWLVPPKQVGDAGVFGLAIALNERPDLFARIPSGARTRWVVSALPPGPYRARFAAYDPATYELLCEPGETLSAEAAQRLWKLNLLSIIAERRSVGSPIADDADACSVTAP
ncbi:MAG: hypothetical protein ACP5HG_05515 [Anaerolineae bacterium]